MLLRSVIAHVKEQNWTAIAIDFVIVIVGVFIGIQVSNWNESRQDTNRIQNYFERLIDDLESEQRALTARLDYMAVTDGYGQTALSSLTESAELPPSDLLVALYQVSQIWTYSVQRATYDELLSSGIAQAIPDASLRTQLANVYLNAEAVRQVVVSEPPYRGRIRFYLPHDIQSLIRESCSDRFLYTENSLMILELPDSCALEFTDDQIARALESLDDYVEIERELVQRLASIAAKRSAIEAQLPLTESIIAELRSRLSESSRRN